MLGDLEPAREQHLMNRVFTARWQVWQKDCQAANQRRCGRTSSGSTLGCRMCRELVQDCNEESDNRGARCQEEPSVKGTQ